MLTTAAIMVTAADTIVTAAICDLLSRACPSYCTNRFGEQKINPQSSIISAVMRAAAAIMITAAALILKAAIIN